MDDYKLIEEDRKRLTAFLGERWYEGLVGQSYTFDTPDDQHEVFTKLVEAGKWDDFYFFAWKELYFKERKTSETAKAITQWLFIFPERFCKLVSDYLKEEGKC